MVGGFEKAGADHAAAAAATTTKKDTYTPSAVELEFDQLVNALELELQESAVKNMENANIGINDPDTGVVTALTTKLPETEFQGEVYTSCESDQPDTQRCMISESEFHLVIDDITKDELKIKVANLESQLANPQVDIIKMLSVETNQNDKESLMLNFDKLCQTCDPDSEFHESHESEFHETEFYTRWNLETNQTVQVLNVHTTSTKADSTRVRTTSTTSESSPASYEFAIEEYSSTSVTEPSLDDKMNIMFKMVDNFKMENVDPKSELLKAVKIEGGPHEIENKYLPSGRPPEFHARHGLHHLRFPPPYEREEALTLPPPRRQTERVHNKECAFDAPQTAQVLWRECEDVHCGTSSGSRMVLQLPPRLHCRPADGSTFEDVSFDTVFACCQNCGQACRVSTQRDHQRD
jgi:hypothetical protein